MILTTASVDGNMGNVIKFYRAVYQHGYQYTKVKYVYNVNTIKTTFFKN